MRAAARSLPETPTQSADLLPPRLPPMPPGESSYGSPPAGKSVSAAASCFRPAGHPSAAAAPRPAAPGVHRAWSPLADSACPLPPNYLAHQIDLTLEHKSAGAPGSLAVDGGDLEGGEVGGQLGGM